MFGECEKCGHHTLDCVCLNDEEQEWMNASLGKIKDKIDEKIKDKIYEKIRADKMEIKIFIELLSNIIIDMDKRILALENKYE